jgi:NTP pyrophosphatase (non-canonical NTP hydrolase)
MTTGSSIEEVFQGRIFKIPDYQRGYAWERKHWTDLTQDLELLPNGRQHFTGTLVLCQNGQKTGKIFDELGRSYTLYDVIDGQQRLTSVILSLDAISHELHRVGQARLAEGLTGMFVQVRDANGQPLTKLTLNRDCQDFFKKDVLNVHPGIEGPAIRSHHLLQSAHDYFERYLADKRMELGEAYPDWLKDLYLKITQGLTVIVYEVADEVDAGVIFETMNDRGKPLSELEKVKNYLLYIASKLDLRAEHNLVHEVNTTWSHIFETLMAAGLGDVTNEDQLLRAHWLMAYDYNPSNWRQSRSIKKRFSLLAYQERHADLLQDLLDYLHTIRNSANAYADIHVPLREGAFNEINDWEIRRRIIALSEKLSRLGSRATFLPLLIAIRLQAQDGGQTYLQAVELCEKFDFRVYQWMGYRSNAGQSRLFRLGHQFFLAPDEEWMILDLRKAIHAYCPDLQFEERFQSETVNWYRWSGIKYFLYEYEQHLAGGRSLKVNWESLDARPKEDSIEHVLPQTPVDHYWTERFTQEQRQRWTHDIGNLTLTYDNSSLSNKSFPKKKGKPEEPGTYAASPLFIERQLASYPEWTSEQIKTRREEIKNWALERWHVEEPPPEPVIAENSFDYILALAEQNGVGEEFEALHAAAEELHLSTRVQKNIQYRPPFNRILSVMNVDIEPGGFRIYFRLDNFARFPGITRDRVDELFPYENHDSNWIPADEIDELVTALKSLAEEIDEMPPPAESITKDDVMESLFSMAEQKGTLEEFRSLLEVAQKLPMYPRTQSNWYGVKFTPYEDKNAHLLWIDPSLYFSADYDNFERYLGIPAERVKATLGISGRGVLEKSEVPELAKRFDQLITLIDKVGLED